MKTSDSKSIAEDDAGVTVNGDHINAPEKRVADSGDDEYVSPDIKGTASKESRRRMYPNGVDILAMIGIIVGTALVAGVVSGIVMIATGYTGEFLTLALYFLQFAMAIGFILLQRKVRGAKTNILKLGPKRINATLILWGLLLIFVTGVVIEPVIALFPSEYMEFLYKSIGTGGWAILLTVAVAPIMEEVLFRGLIQGSIAEKYGPATGILLSALIFGLIHGIPQQVVNAFLVGIILGYIYYRTGSLLAVIVLHAVNNGVSYLQMEIFGTDSADMSLRMMIGNDKLYYVAYGISLALMAVGVVAIARNLHLQDKRLKTAQAEENSSTVE